MDELDAGLAALDAQLRGLGSVLVAFSGGADSAFLLAAAVRALGTDRVAAATAVSPSLAAAELPAAQAYAAGLGVRHLLPGTDELARPGYVANGADRCFHCKATLLDTLRPLADELGLAAVATGTNADDAVAGFRPGIAAAAGGPAGGVDHRRRLFGDRGRAGRGRRGGGRRVGGRPAVPAAAGRLPGHRHPRLLRDRPRPAPGVTGTQLGFDDTVGPGLVEPIRHGRGRPHRPPLPRTIGQQMTHLGGALGLNGVPAYGSAFWVAVVVVLTLVLTVRLKYSAYGRSMLAVREDDVAAAAVGVNLTKYKVRAFVYSAFFAGLGGGLMALKNGTINAGELGFQRSFDFVIMVVLGGLGSVSGAAIAAVLLTLLPEWLRGVREYRMVIFAVVLVVTMIVRPRGLLGLRELWDYLPRPLRVWERAAARPVAGVKSAGLLDVDNVSITFGGLKAVQGFSLSLPAGGLYGLIGPNGAGKSTAFNLMTGVYRPQTGTVRVDGVRVDGLKTHAIVSAGLARTFQNIRLFGDLTVLDNVKLGGQLRRPHSIWATLCRTWPDGGRRAGDGPPVPGPAGRVQAGRPGRRAGPQPALRRPAAAGDRPRPGHRPQGAPAGRAGRRHEPGREGRTDGP